MSRSGMLALTSLLGSFAVACTTASKPNVEAEGREMTTRTGALEGAAQVVQRDSPTAHLGVYLVGFHPMKMNGEHQMEAHHFCNQVNEDFMQCALFDGNTKDANLNGIEYIISEKVYGQLPEKERQYWHPHNYEILSGMLVAPGIPVKAETELMKQKMNSYGKTWHVWNTGNDIGDKGDRLPYGPPQLAWSFNRNGEIKPGLSEARDRRLELSTAVRREDRKGLVNLAHPQGGVDAMLGEFARPTSPMPGVEDSKRATAH